MGHVETLVDAKAMATGEPLGGPPRTLVAVRWALIAVCAALIVFSHDMAGRIGFAALLVFAIVVGRYRSRRFAASRRPAESLDTGTQSRTQSLASDEPTQHREAGQ